MEKQNEFKTGDPGSVSWGTLQPFDLVHAFIEELNRLGHPREEVQTLLSDLPKGVLHKRDDDWWQTEEALWTLDDLTMMLSSHAPDGYYFGTHEGDGSDFGFWAHEDCLGEGEPLQVASPGSAVSGKIRIFDIMLAFLKLLRELKHPSDRLAKLISRVPPPALLDSAHSWWNGDIPYVVLEDIYHLLNLHAPEGHHFGGSSEDDFNFGYWPDRVEGA